MDENWGLGDNAKILWVHFDEKWFKALVPRSNAKMCPALGIEKDSMSVHHKSHIEQVMMCACLFYAFEGSPENGGEGGKIGFHRAMCARVALKDQRKSTRDVNGDLHYDGPLIREKGDVYFVDANVTGSNCGTATKPKFALKELWKHHIFPKLDALTRGGPPGIRGPYHGYKVVLQQDGAGPHTEGDLAAYLQGEVGRRDGWLISDQAPQSPYVNVLDLAVFPGMSKQHSKLLQRYNGTAVPKSVIESTAQRVWAEMPSADIARGFIQAYRVMRMIIQYGGNNKWLSNGGPHCNVRRDFKNTARGCALK